MEERRWRSHIWFTKWHFTLERIDEADSVWGIQQNVRRLVSDGDATWFWQPEKKKHEVNLQWKERRNEKLTTASKNSPGQTWSRHGAQAVNEQRLFFSNSGGIDEKPCVWITWDTTDSSHTNGIMRWSRKPFGRCRYSSRTGNTRGFVFQV